MINYTKTIYNQKHKHILKWISINSTNKIKSVHVRHSLFAVIFLKERSVLKAERKNKRRSFHAQSFDYEKLCNFHFSQSQCSSRLRRRSSSICTKIHLFKHKTLTFFLQNSTNATATYGASLKSDCCRQHLDILQQFWWHLEIEKPALSID